MAVSDTRRNRCRGLIMAVNLIFKIWTLLNLIGLQGVIDKRQPAGVEDNKIHKNKGPSKEKNKDYKCQNRFCHQGRTSLMQEKPVKKIQNAHKRRNKYYGP